MIPVQLQLQGPHYQPLQPKVLVFQLSVQTTIVSALMPQASMHRPTATLPPQSLPRPNFQETGVQQPTMNQPGISPYTTQVYQPSPQAHMSSFPTPHFMRNPSTAELTPRGTEYVQIPQLHMSQAEAKHSQVTLHLSASSA